MIHRCNREGEANAQFPFNKLLLNTRVICADLSTFTLHLNHLTIKIIKYKIFLGKKNPPNFTKILIL
ncbi:hypothetical protein AQUCO_03400411v1 [Aquilegia coerulea]|uniref:Uncharacterized protein n=1 Tax=Aquilegia coerulea TaxID=218851 RepID=A0A2G5CYY3_AQUCA|nr:hypothetical protein AQUCO_03400411v1 [Aquilegia coerulea]